MKPICVPCQQFFRVEENGFSFIEAMPIGPGRAAPGTVEPDKWTPYKIWSGDKWKCHGCGAVIVVGCGSLPIAEHYQEGFEKKRQSLGADQLQVNDC